MKRLKYILVILIFFWSCQKRPFSHVEVHGRIVSTKTNQPLQAQIQLWTGAYPPGSKGSSEFGSTRTGGDGSFDIKSNAGWSSDDYYIEIIPDSISTHSSASRHFTITRNQNVDAGTISL